MKFICLKMEFLTMCAVIIILMLLLESCVHESLVDPVAENPDPPPVGEDTCDENTVYFENEVLPLLISNCAKSGCHDAATAEEGIILNSYSSVMQSDVVNPGDPGESELYEKITESDPDDVMPPFPEAPLNATQIATIRTWIAQGAQNNKCNNSACDTTNVTYSASVLPLMTNKCRGCHSGNTPSGNLDFTSYQALQTVALDGRLMGSVTHANGYVPMPQGGSKLSACEIDMIRIWIDASAPNN
jgi:hypothetical protein